jgi:GT2 family glycosyltransferase
VRIPNTGSGVTGGGNTKESFLMSETAIVILNWNGINYLKKFLGIVIKHCSGKNTEIYLADNGSTDGSLEWVATKFSEIKLIRFDKNHGFAKGYNLALDQIDARYYVLLNSDIEVSEKWLQPMLRFMENNPDVASCQPKILSYNRREFFEYAGASGGFIDRLGYPLCRGRILNKIEKDNGQYDSSIDIFWSTGACMMVRAEAWRKVGGFDPNFFAHMEEIDLCWRFQRIGFRVTVIPQSKVYHVGGGALPYNSPFKTYLNFRNSLFLLYRNLPEKNFRKIMFTRKILDGIAAIFFLCKGQIKSTRSVWRAHMDFYKKISELKTSRRIILNSGNKEPGKLILNKSIVFEFYIKRNRTFSSLKTKL